MYGPLRRNGSWAFLELNPGYFTLLICTIPAHLFVVRKRKKCIFSLKKCFLLKSHGKLESVAIAVNPFLLINF